MNRLTERMLGGVVLPEIPMEIKNKEELEEYHRVRKIYEESMIKLGQYEDIGLDPEELQQLVNRHKWHVVADGDLPPKPESSMKRYLVTKVREQDHIRKIVVDLYWDGNSFYHGLFSSEIHDILAWRELPEPWEGAVK